MDKYNNKNAHLPAINVRQSIDGNEPLGEFSIELDGDFGRFIVRDCGSHQQAGLIRQYIDKNYNFFFYFTPRKLADGDPVFEVTDITTAKLSGSKPNIKKADLINIKNNIEKVFRTRFPSDVCREQIMPPNLNIKYSWEI